MRDESASQLIQFATTLHENQGSEDQILQTILKHMGRVCQATQGCIISFDAAAQVQQVYALGAQSASHSTRREVWENLLHYGVVGLAYYGRQVVTLRNLRTDPRWSDVSQISFLPSEGSAAAVPICRDDSILAVALLTHPRVDTFQRDHAEYLEAAAKIAAPALQTAHRLEQSTQVITSYQTLFDNTLVPMLLTDDAGIIRNANKEAGKYLGFNRADLQGVSLQDLNVSVETQEELAGLAEDEERFITTSIYDIEGREIPTMIRIRHLEYNGEHVLEWMLQDISTQMELEQLRRDLTSMVYHDLRGPLSNVQAAMLTLNRMLDGTENPVIQRMLELGQRSTRQLKQMVDGLLDIQRLEDGSNMLNRQVTNLHDTLHDVFALTQPIASEVQQTIVLKIAPALPLLFIDSDMMIRVLLNLVENAIKYTPERGIIELHANAQGGELVVKVRDNGPGIPPEMRYHVFDKFSRIRHTNAPKGVGLGLAFCRLAVEAHEGRIWVESDGRTGSDFIFSLPLANNRYVPDDETVEADIGAGSDPKVLPETPPRHNAISASH